MVVSVSFNKRVPPGAANARGTLAEMMARQKAYADSRGTAMQEETPTIMQGLGKVANVMANAWGERQAMNSEAAGRERLAAIRAGIDLDKGPTSQQIGEAGVLDEDYARQLQEQALQLRKDAAARELEKRGQDITTHGQDLSAQVQREGQGVTAAGNQLQADVTREGQGVTAAGNQLQADVTREGQGVTKAGNQLQADVTREGQGVTAAGNQLSADVQREGFRSAESIADAKARADLANDPSFQPVTPEDIISFNLKPAIDKGASFKIKIVNGQREPIQIGTAPQDSALSGEVSARLGMMDDYFKNFGSIMKDVEAGAVSGPLNYAQIQAGMPGRGTDILRIVQSGSEALVRNLTGAGMPESEARKYVSRYEPGVWSVLGPADAKAKLQKLYTDMWNVHDAVVQGHRYTDSPDVFKLDMTDQAAPADPNAAPAQNFPERPVSAWDDEELKLGRQTH